MQTNAPDSIHLPGKPTSALNALKNGLFAAHDFIRLGERGEYDAFAAAFRDQLTPEGPLEDLFAAEIVSANWRLRRCRLVEEELSARYDIDPLEDDAGAKIQRSVDRARAHAHNVIRRALAELRKLQTERHIRTGLDLQDNYGVAEFPKITSALAKYGPKPAETGEPAQPGNPEDRNPWELDLNNPDHFAAFDKFILTSPLGRLPQHRDSFCNSDSGPAEPGPQPEDTGASEPGLNSPQKAA
ncbi:MAG: hypothetical protein KGN84_22795 [Acidobacteriota bacterium]|nr:hypothetical protein [Acidobacteriota bacterium]